MKASVPVTGEEVTTRLREYFSRHNLRQKGVAIDCGMTAAKISQLMHGKRRLQLDDYLTICAVIELDPAALLAADYNP